MNKEKEQWWCFTFGCGQEHAHHYVRLFGTMGSTREKMFEHFGMDWSFQYRAEDPKFKSAVKEWNWKELTELPEPQPKPQEENEE